MRPEVPLFIMNSAKFLALQPHIMIDIRIYDGMHKKNSTLFRPEPWKLSLSLLMLWIFADNSDASFSLDDFALLANRFN